jgi:thymidylate synthase (FAD)
MAHMVVEVQTTRQVSAQIIRHRSFAFQEFSQRYAKVSSIPEMPEMRLAGATNRQSSLSAELTPGQKAASERAENLMLLLYGAYEEMVATGIANESARAVLPMCTPTMLYMSGSIRSFLHYCQVRMTPDTQKEHREIAEGIAHILSTEVPIVWNAFQRYCIDKE